MAAWREKRTLKFTAPRHYEWIAGLKVWRQQIWNGYSNLLEYAFGTDPLKGGNLRLADGLGMPVFSLVNECGTFYQTLSCPRRRAGLRQQPEICQPWSAS